MTGAHVLYPRTGWSDLLIIPDLAGYQLNVSGEAIDGTLWPIPRVKPHFRILPYTEVAEALVVMVALEASPSAELTTSMDRTASDGV